MQCYLSLLLFAPAVLAATPSPTGPITVTLSPANAVLRLQGRMTFTATVSGATANRTVHWRVNGVTGGNVVVGAISTSGAYQAPSAMPNGGYVDISAVSNADPTKIGTVRLTLQNPVPTLGSIQPGSANYNLATVIVAKGGGYVTGSQIVVNGVPQTTAFVSATELRANYRPVTPAGSTLTVLVRNPNPGGADSAAKTIPVLGPVTVSVSPQNRTIRGGATAGFSASIQNTTNRAVDWFVNGVKGGTPAIGLIDANGLYQAPPLAPTPNVVLIKAVSQFDARGADTVQLTVLNPVPAILSTAPTGLRTGQNTLGITGKGLARDVTVTLDNVPVPVTWSTPTQIRITANVAPALGGYAVLRATNPNPGGTSSAPYNIEVVIKPGLMPEGAATRFLEQATWGPNPESVARLVEIGREQWLTEQFALPPSAYDDPESESQGLTKLRRNFFRNALRGPDQLRQRVAWALGQIFVISGNELEYYWQHVPYVRMLNQHAFSNYREIMQRVALSPAMGEYLDMVNNAKPDPVRGLVPNENFGRELLQLFTIGLTKLNPDGTRQLDAQGMPAPAYSEDEIKQLSLALTGWTYPPRPGFTSKWKNAPYYLAEMVAFEQHHDITEKNFLGQRVNAGQTARQDLERALDIIFAHPNVGPFVAYRMIQRLVTANPTPAYVGRVAAAFNNNGSGVRGDMRAVVRAVLMDPEASIIKTDQGQLREPVLFVTTLLRALNATVTDFPSLDGFTREMSQNVFTPPSVFNYFSPFFRLMPANIPSPEFQIYNPTTALERVNFAYRASRNSLGSSISIPVDHFAAVADDPAQLLTAVSKALMRGGLPPDMRASILTAILSTNDLRERARMAIYLVASSSRFSVRQSGRSKATLIKRRYQFSRRELLRRGARLVSTLTTASAAAPFGSLNALAQGPDYKALVCIFNFGGNDSNNMWVTRGPQYARYQAERQALAIPLNTLLPVVTPADEPYGFHPSLAAIHPLWASKRLAVVQNVGTLVRPLTRSEYQNRTKPAPMNLFSHSDQQQQWQNASPLAPLTTGWGGRIADRVQGLNSPSNFPPAVAISGNSLQLVGAETRPTSIDGELALEGNDGTTVGNARQTALQQILEFDTGVALFQAASRVVKDALEVARQVDDATRSTNPLPVVFPNTGLGNQLQQVAKIIQVRGALGMRRQIFFVTQGGYDTHNDQAGNHSALLLEMAQAMSAFYQATVALGVAEQVVTFNESDFNRTFNPNNGAGTDHAWGGHYLVMGGAIKGGDAYGRYPELIKQGPDDSGNRGNWIPTTSIDQYGATMASWFGVPDLDMPIVFPNINNFAARKLGFL